MAMCRYSPSKNITNKNPLYSLKKPIINSVSDSTKSNGARPKSIKNMKNSGTEISIKIVAGYMLCFSLIKILKLKLLEYITIKLVASAIVISMFNAITAALVDETVVYLFLSNGPTYIIILFESAISSTKLTRSYSNGKYAKLFPQVMENINNRFIIRYIVGNSASRDLFTFCINIVSFSNSFRASAMNWLRPLYPAMFGPTRLWISAKNFLSNIGSAPANNTDPRVYNISGSAVTNIPHVSAW